jgi:hypothetical protein
MDLNVQSCHKNSSSVGTSVQLPQFPPPVVVLVLEHLGGVGADDAFAPRDGLLTSGRRPLGLFAYLDRG